LIIYWVFGYVLHDEWSRTAVVYDTPSSGAHSKKESKKPAA